MKKIFAFTIASFIALSAQSALAGGPDQTMPVPVTYSGTYIEGEVGYGLRNWNDVQDFTGGVSTENASGGFSGGFDIGYQFNEFISLEGGWLYLPQFKESLAGNSDTFTSWAAYGGFKFTVPLIQDLFIFAKIAGAYNQTSPGSNLVTTGGVNYSGDNDYWTPLFGFGLQYYFNQNVSINAEYVHIPGEDQPLASEGHTPDSNIFLAGVGYKFAI